MSCNRCAHALWSYPVAVSTDQAYRVKAQPFTLPCSSRCATALPCGNAVDRGCLHKALMLSNSIAFIIEYNVKVAVNVLFWHVRYTHFECVGSFRANGRLPSSPPTLLNVRIPYICQEPCFPRNVLSRWAPAVFIMAVERVVLLLALASLLAVNAATTQPSAPSSGSFVEWLATQSSTDAKTASSYYEEVEKVSACLKTTTFGNCRPLKDDGARFYIEYVATWLQCLTLTFLYSTNRLSACSVVMTEITIGRGFVVIHSHGWVCCVVCRTDLACCSTGGGDSYHTDYTELRAEKTIVGGCSFTEERFPSPIPSAGGTTVVGTFSGTWYVLLRSHNSMAEN